MPEVTTPRKFRRLGLYLPFALLVVAAVCWSAFWLWAKADARERINSTAADLRRAGYEVGWKDLILGGYPFRLNAAVTDLRIANAAGWALEAPRLEAEAFMHAPRHWVMATPQGLTFNRPVAGRVAVSGKLIRASLSGLDRRPPNFSFEGVDLTFQPGPGAQAFPLAGAGRVEFHLRAGPDDEGGVFAKIDNGEAAAGGVLAEMARGKPVTLGWNATLSRMSAFKGSGWADMVRAWSRAGGVLRLRDASLSAGPAAISASGSDFKVGTDGRLSGAVNVAVADGGLALAALGRRNIVPPEGAAAAALVLAARQEDPGKPVRATLTFQAGGATLGPVALAPAPKVYEPR